MQAELEMVEANLVKNTEGRARLVELYRDGGCIREEFNEQVAKLAEKRIEIEARAGELRQLVARAETRAEGLRSVRSSLEVLRSFMDGKPSFETRRKLLQGLISSIKVEAHGGEKREPIVDITYRFDSHLNRMLQEMDRVRKARGPLKPMTVCQRLR